MPPSLWNFVWLSYFSYGNNIFLSEYSLTKKNIDIFVVVFKAWDLARSTRNVLLYNISRNQLLGSSERRFWAILLFWSFKSAISCLLGHFRWFSSFGRYLDRFGLRFSIMYLYIYIYIYIYQNQLLGCSERRFWTRFAPPEVNYASKSTSRIINFDTWDWGRSPRCPQGAPKGRTTDP